MAIDEDLATGAAFVPRSGESWRSPWSMYTALRDHDPVHHVERGDYWVLSRFDDVFAAVRDHETFSSADGLTFNRGEREQAGLAEAAPLVMLDPPEHTEFRRLVGKGFTPRHVCEIEPQVRSFVVERLERLRERGEGDIVAEVFKPLPSFVVAYYLGVPQPDWPRFDRWTEAIVAANADGDPANVGDAVGELFEYFTALVDAKRADPGDDTVSQLVATGDGDRGEDVSILKVLGFAFTMVAGGNDTTTGLLSVGCELLTRHRDQRQRLLDDPGLIESGVEEMLRLASPVQGLARTPTSDVELHGRTIPAGRKVMMLYASANRDPRRFGPTAGEFDVTRSTTPIMSFGYGAHFCLGASAARLQANVAMQELLARCPDFAVDPDAGTFAPGHFVRRYASLPFVASAG